jgi:hypothetical protein
MVDQFLNDPQTGDPETSAARYRSGPSARVIKTSEYDEDAPVRCTNPDCGWTGTASQCVREFYDALYDLSCPDCDTMLLIVSYS